MMKSLAFFLFSTFICSSFAVTNFWSDFEGFRERFQKKYESLEELENRFKIFRDNVQKIHEHNKVANNYTLAVNKFTDLTEDEFRQRYVGGFSKKADLLKGTCSKFSVTGDETPSTVDWRKTAVTPVKNQEQCGSCWSFSATGAMEGAWAISSGELISLSEQQLVDCSKKYGNMGCNGGLMDNAFLYAIDVGMCSEQAYPYTAAGATCVASSCDKVVQMKFCKDVPASNQEALREAVALKGPVSIAIEADTKIFQSYSSGVITGTSCGTNLDHGVLIVGYGTENGVKYWLVKNSWGTSWGDEGYVKIGRSDSTNDPGVCGIAMQPSFPVV